MPQPSVRPITADDTMTRTSDAPMVALNLRESNMLLEVSQDCQGAYGHPMFGSASNVSIFRGERDPRDSMAGEGMASDVHASGRPCVWRQLGTSGGRLDEPAPSVGGFAVGSFHGGFSE